MVLRLFCSVFFPLSSASNSRPLPLWVIQVRQMMVKDNILKSMLNEKAQEQLKLDAPDPSDFLSGPGDAPSAGSGGGGRGPPGAPPPQGGVK